ncbi:MAG: hypothetical protein C5B50_24315 [Verrucomicrobia bacterium]|nr:MAG: hypothetical protein C5B50_24315 [Verrucomicrobiota bacterium]
MLSHCKSNELAKRRLLSLPLEPLFIADWDRVLMIHYEVDAGRLQAEVPFELDLMRGRAFVSLVCFTMRGMRPGFGGDLTAWPLKLISTHEFLNVRTYVKHRQESGIYFLVEWVPNRVSAILGPAVFGLPYRFGRITYNHFWENGTVTCHIRVDLKEERQTQSRAERRALSYAGTIEERAGFKNCEDASLDEWLMERYTAFTCHRGRRRFFRVWHEPWMQTRASISMKEQTLLERNWPLFRDSRLISANFSPGARNVWMGWPHRTR